VKQIRCAAPPPVTKPLYIVAEDSDAGEYVRFEQGCWRPSSGTGGTEVPATDPAHCARCNP
jgi:hypothetical protein